MICNVEFKLTDARVRCLDGAGIHSIRDLYKVLGALDLRAIIQLEPWQGPPAKDTSVPSEEPGE
jgi:hypothetical protein